LLAQKFIIDGAGLIVLPFAPAVRFTMATVTDIPFKRQPKQKHFYECASVYTAQTGLMAMFAKGTLISVSLPGFSLQYDRLVCNVSGHG
jgi:hypothetical protein